MEHVAKRPSSRLRYRNHIIPMNFHLQIPDVQVNMSRTDLNEMIYQNWWSAPLIGIYRINMQRINEYTVTLLGPVLRNFIWKFNSRKTSSNPLNV